MQHQQTWSYDNSDRLSATATPLGTLAYTYDDNSRLLSTTSSTGLLPESRTVVKCSSGSETRRTEVSVRPSTVGLS
ncbi:MAG: hypothetical protein IPK22_19460 [Verrucomicrobiaceae bacterium]|nr:hypothetical protein [Verrucomicrobiaceae bacterium]